MAARPLFTNRLTTGLGGVAVAGVGAVLYYRFMMPTAHADSGSPPKAFGKGPAFLSLKLESSVPINDNTKRLRFELPTQDTLTGLSISSALLTYSWPKGSWLPCVRPYTPITYAEEPGVLEFLIKKYPNGKQSTHMHSLQAGDTMRFLVPIPGYKWTPNKHPDVTFIAGGAGITPMYALIEGILRNPEEKTRITLVFGVNTDADVLLKKEFDAYAQRYPGRFKAVYTVSNPMPGSPLRKGYVTKELLEEVGASPKVKNTKVFVCGPPPMEAALMGTRKQPGILEQMGYTKDQIYKF
ncbi:Uu.00g130920.m01.CDS01 [Anthostomella pinea]|uniref:NADH-cytochrome b5 reductase n=1 Tax=Anthostomella pinea TaxID=933095 RepID=A0AAI8YFT5_9PEZI|nr:Uu.00g130920.m01.CDS01 [Anthostomella pinea]